MTVHYYFDTKIYIFFKIQEKNKTVQLRKKIILSSTSKGENQWKKNWKMLKDKHNFFIKMCFFYFSLNLETFYIFSLFSCVFDRRGAFVQVFSVLYTRSPCH